MLTYLEDFRKKRAQQSTSTRLALAPRGHWQGDGIGDGIGDDIAAFNAARGTGSTAIEFLDLGLPCRDYKPLAMPARSLTLSPEQQAAHPWQVPTGTKEIRMLRERRRALPLSAQRRR